MSVRPVHLALLLLAAAMPAVPAAAQLVPFGREQRVDTKATHGSCPALASDAGGGFTVAWPNPQDEHRMGCDPAGLLYTRSYSRDGRPEAPPFLAARTGYECVLDFRIGPATEDGSLLTWSQKPGKGSPLSLAATRVGSDDRSVRTGGGLVPLRSGDLAIFSWVYNNAQNRGSLILERRQDPQVPGPRIVVARSQHYLSEVDAAETADGGLIVVWLEQAPAATTIRGRRLDAAGSPIGPSFLISDDDTPTTVYGPAIAANEAGQFVVTWTGGPDWDDAMARIYDAAGQPVGPRFRVSFQVAGYQIHHRPAIDEQGNFVVLWSQYQQPDLRSQLFARMFDATGRRLGPELLLAENLTWPVGCGSVESLGDGLWVLAWGRRGFGVTFQRFISG